MARRTRRRRHSAVARALRRAGLALVAGVVLGPLLAVLVLRWVPPPTSAFMLADLWTRRQAGYPEWRPAYDWRRWEEISPWAGLAVVAAEDQKFPHHHGFDVRAIRQALGEARAGGRLRGASTISQQTAKNLFLWREQTLVRKGVELYFTVLMELAWPKRRILEVYLNVAQFGPGVYGVEAASARYFQKSASALTPQEAALLAAALPAPSRLDVRAPGPYLRRRQAWVLRQMDHLGTAYLARV
jgi:monofunctional glycosyltransferase